MWRTLSAVSANRSLVLTTHAMEEADALANRVGIMAKKMLALGTSDSLRRKHGDAYYVHLVHRDAPHSSDADMHAIAAWVRRNFPAARVEDRSFHGQMRFSVPNRGAGPTAAGSSAGGGYDVAEAGGAKKMATATVTAQGGSEASGSGGTGTSISALFQKLEQNKEDLGMEFYAVSQATLDQVFLSIVTKHNVEEENYGRSHPVKVGAWGRVKKGLVTLLHNA